MNLLPVIQRELRMRARQGATYWTRGAVSAIAVMVGLEELSLASSTQAASAVGPATFSAVSWLGFLVACGSALVTADAISRERREGTLGLLLLTALRGFDIVLGKLCAAGLTAAYALVGFLPALPLVMLAGGVTGGEQARTALALLNASFVALTAGIWVSGRAQSRSSAVRGTLILVLLLCALPRILMHICLGFTPRAWLLGSCSPFTAFFIASDDWTPAYFLALGISHLEGWLLLLWTASTLLHHWRTVEWSPPPKRIVWEPVVESEAEALAAGRKALKEDDPICWAVGRMRIQSALIFTGTCLLLLGGTGFSFAILMAGSTRAVAAMGMWNSFHLLASLASAALMAWAAGRFLFETQRNGELEMLLCTPVGARDIVGGNWRALAQPLRGACVLVAFLVLLEFVFGHSPGSGTGWGYGVFQRVMAPVIRVLDLIALCWMGMWFGLRARRPFSIIGWTVGLVVGVPWVLSYVFIISLSLNNASVWQGSGSPAVLFFWFIAWPLINVAKDFFFINWAVRKLRAELRTEASLAAGRLTA